MKILYVTTIASTMEFFEEHFRMLRDDGHQVELACNNTRPYNKGISDLQLKTFHVPFSRSPLSPDNFAARKQLKQIIIRGNYDIVHCHTPNAAAITRLVCKGLRKKGLKVFYTAHGFHFYKGAPLKNWLLFYPVEWLCAHWTDLLITINREDYKRAEKNLHAKNVVYVPGVGLDLSRFSNVSFDRAAVRKELGVPEGAILLLSVGELNTNKNHQIVIRAIAQLKDPDIYYAIAGSGSEKEHLIQLANQMDVADQVHLLGFRTDVPALYYSSDICCFPSIREGLPMAALEGMACGLPLIAADNRGTRDLCTDGENGFLCEFDNVQQFADRIRYLRDHPESCRHYGAINKKKAMEFSVAHVLKYMKDLYETYGL